MQRRLCEMSEAKWSITEAKCLQMSHNKYASQRDAISHSMGNLMLSHSAGMHNNDKSIAGISKRFHFASLHYIFSAYLPTHIKFLTEFHRIFFGTTCISFPLCFPRSLCSLAWNLDFFGKTLRLFCEVFSNGNCNITIHQANFLLIGEHASLQLPLSLLPRHFEDPLPNHEGFLSFRYPFREIYGIYLHAISVQRAHPI